MSALSPRVLKIVAALLALALPVIPGVPTFWVTLGVFIGLASLVAIGLVLLTGVGGMTSFGQAAFVGFGAYTTAVLTVHYGVSPWLTLPASLAATGLAAFVIGAVTVRLSGHFLPLGTIAWGIAFYYLFGNLTWLGSHDGISAIPPLSVAGTQLYDTRSFYFVVWAAVVLALVATSNLLDSRMGRAIRALRRGGAAAESFGVNAPRVKLVVFVYAALLAGLSGWLYAHFQRAVAPSAFGINAGIEYLLMAVVGGAGHLYGAILGAGVIVILKDLLKDWLPLLFGSRGNYEAIVFGILLVAMLQGARTGLWPLLASWFPRIGAPRRARTSAEPPPQREQPAAGEPLLSLDRARKNFGGLVAVNDVSFAVRSGEILGLIGPNGAGKSTTFNLVTGVSPASSGTVTFRGERIERLEARHVAGLGIARSFQHVKLVPDMSVIDNVALGAHLRGSAGVAASLLRLERGEEARLFAEAWRQLDRTGIAEHAAKPAASLALGQMRVVEIARALALDPVLLLLDEPAAGLRHVEKQALAALLRKLSGEGVTILLVEHDMDFVMKVTDRIVVLDFGQKIAEGSPAEIRVDPAVREAYLGGVE
jgi:ABC-type branched-subunit amino acid transport system ATPase component/ABC-type branched-subunit amino acid transport system permease subunit